MLLKIITYQCLMEPRYFTCNPEKFCGDASCCSNTYPFLTLSVNDFLRMGDYDQQKVLDAWEQHGEVSLSVTDRRDDGITYRVGLGIITRPCTFLKDDRCAIYEKRPLDCAFFPGIEMLKKGTNEVDAKYGEVECLRNVRLSDRRMEALRRLDEIAMRFAMLDIEHFPHASLDVDFRPTTNRHENNFHGYCARALGKMIERRDKGVVTPRNDRVYEADVTLNHLHKMMVYHDLGQKIHPPEVYRERNMEFLSHPLVIFNFRAIAHELFQEGIGKALAELAGNGKLAEMFREADEEYENVLKMMGEREDAAQEPTIRQPGERIL